MSVELLKANGFVPGLTIHWINGKGDFKITPLHENILKAKSIIYCWFDAKNNIIMNVGRAKGTIKARFLYSGGYEKWLNGLRKGDIDTKIRYKWLGHLQKCESGQVQVYYKTCELNSLPIEEVKLIKTLNPLLNVRRK